MRPRLTAHITHGNSRSAGNATAFGYSVTITATFGAVSVQRGQPSFGDLILFGMGAVVAFGGLEGLLNHGFREPLEPGTDQGEEDGVSEKESDTCGRARPPAGVALPHRADYPMTLRERAPRQIAVALRLSVIRT